MSTTIALVIGALVPVAAAHIEAGIGAWHATAVQAEASSADDGSLRAGPQPPERLESARELVPLLDGIERRVSTRVRLEPGELPPSPFSGTRATLFAFRIVDGRSRLDERVARAIERLQAWHKAPQAGESTTAELADAWLDHLILKVGGVVEPGPGQQPGRCDVPCSVSALLEPSASFGRTRRDRENVRDWILLDALTAAVEELEPGR